MKPPDREAVLRALRPRRSQILFAVLGLLLLARIALPWVLRPVIVSQADAALIGRVELADIDLSLIRGGVTLEGLSVHVDERPSTEPALFEAKRLWTQISWLALVTKTIEVEEFELEGFVLRVDRLKDGLLLPRPAPGQTAEPEEVADSEPLGWSFAADSVALRDGEIVLRDHTVGDEPQRFDLAVKDLSAQDLALRVDPSGHEPGRLVIQAQLGQGSVGLDAQVTQHAGGPGGRSKLTLANIPIEKVRLYLKMFGWSDLSGTLDAAIEHQFEPGGVHRVGGSASLSNVAVRVPALDRSVLDFEKLLVTLDTIDVVKQDAAVAEVRLVGARVVVDAHSDPPFPLLARHRAELEAEAAAEAQPAEPAEPEPPAKPWTWRVGAARVERAVAELLGGDQPLPLGIDAELRSLSSEPGSRWPVSLRVSEGAGTLGVDGTLALDPVAFDGKLAIKDLALAPLLSRINAPAVGLVRQGTARADIAIALAGDLRVAGKLGLAGLEVGDETTAKEFGVGWKDFELGIGEVTVPGVLGGGDGAVARKIGVKLDLVRLVEPSFKLTRTAQGIVLPPFGDAVEPAQEEVATAAAVPAPEPPSEPAAPATEIALQIASARIDAARGQISDRSVSPFFSTPIERLDLRASGIRWPGPRVEKIAVTMLGLNGAKLDVNGAIVPGNSKIDAKLVKLPLAQFNPYVTPTGYALADGTLSLESKATLDKESYSTSTDVVVSQLEMGGSEGESLFQQNFGIPLSVALGLLKDLDGNITLAVPLEGDRGGARVGLGSVVGQALRKALIGALASPLKLLGAVMSDGKVKLTPEPILFAPGEKVMVADGHAQTEHVARLLAASPGIALTLYGGISESDLSVLRERALYAELDATSGVRALGQLGAIRTRRAVRLFLEAKLGGQPTIEPLDPEDQAWLEEHVAMQSLDPAVLSALASARSTAVKEALVRDHGIADARLTLGAAVIEPPAAKAGVAIGLGTASKSPPPVSGSGS